MGNELGAWAPPRPEHVRMPMRREAKDDRRGRLFLEKGEVPADLWRRGAMADANMGRERFPVHALLMRAAPRGEAAARRWWATHQGGI